MTYDRPLAQIGPHRPEEARPLAGGWAWFTQVERLRRDGPARILPAAALSEEALARLTAPRPPLAGLSLDRPRLMGILNVTPDSFSDGGRHADAAAARAAAGVLRAEGAEIVDIGGESTRPGATPVPHEVERARVLPVIDAAAGLVSIDTRNAVVAEAAVAAGAAIVNDVSGLDHDPAMAQAVARTGAALILMHAQGTPETMQDAPAYDDVLLDVYDALADKIARAEAAGIPRDRIAVDPGIGFGKTQDHNLALLRRISLFHGLGTPVLLGVSRKGFIGRIGAEPDATRRGPGSLAVFLHAAGQGIQIARVHDVAQHAQALRLWWETSGAKPAESEGR